MECSNYCNSLSSDYTVHTPGEALAGPDQAGRASELQESILDVVVDNVTVATCVEALDY